MTARTERLYIWCGPAGMVLLFAGLIIGRLLPLPAPGENANQIAAFFQHHATAVRVGGVVAMMGAACLGPWVAALASRLKSASRPGSPAAYCQLALGSFFVLETIFPLMFLETAAFRLDRPPVEIQALSDLCWIPFVGLAETFTVEAILLGITILSDRAEAPVFPRWMGWYSILAGAIFTFPANIIVFFKTGPFAWDGVLGWWLVAVSFGAWLVGMTALMLQSVGREAGVHSSKAGDLLGPSDSELRLELARLSAEVGSLRHALAPPHMGIDRNRSRAVPPRDPGPTVRSPVQPP